MRFPYAELHPAFRFDCDECGHENFVRGITLEDEHLSQSQRETLESAEFWVLYPEMVQCDHCETVFVTFEEDES
jgi:hypothetical protein